jgi:hypothetical protein
MRKEAKNGSVISLERPNRRRNESHFASKRNFFKNETGSPLHGSSRSDPGKLQANAGKAKTRKKIKK